MPSRRTHKKISKIITGEYCDITHQIIDYPVKYLGRGHRNFLHDPISAGIIGLLAEGYKGLVSAESHIVVDRLVTYFSTGEIGKYVRFLEKLISRKN